MQLGSKSALFLMAAFVAALSVGVSFLFLTSPGGLRGYDDVGGLEGLRAVQAQLASLDACRIEYNMHVRHRDGKVRVLPCAALPYVVFPVPASWPNKDIAFRAERSTRQKKWEIRVDRSRVAFPDLVAALEHLAPILTAEYPAALAATSAQERSGLAAVKALEEERRQASERAKSSYPTQ